MKLKFGRLGVNNDLIWGCKRSSPHEIKRVLQEKKLYHLNQLQRFIY